MLIVARFVAPDQRPGHERQLRAQGRIDDVPHRRGHGEPIASIVCGWASGETPNHQPSTPSSHM
jgi:hypothetical protein